MYRHNPADLITYYMLPRDWRERIPVRLGVGTRQSVARRNWIAFTASIVPALPFSLFAAGIAFVVTQDRFALWASILSATFAAVVIACVMNLYLDRFIMHKVIWLRRARCRPFRAKELTPTRLGLLHSRRQPYLDRLNGKPEQSLPTRGAPPYTLLPVRAMRSFTSPVWCVLLPQSVIVVLWTVLSGAAASGIVFLMFGMNTSHLMRNMVLQSVGMAGFQFFYFARMNAVVKRALGMANRHCPHCGHDLATIATENDNAGPRRCPECGSHWPLVPPPTPKELRELEKHLHSARVSS